MKIIDHESPRRQCCSALRQGEGRRIASIEQAGCETATRPCPFPHAVCSCLFSGVPRFTASCCRGCRWLLPLWTSPAHLRFPLSLLMEPSDGRFLRTGILTLYLFDTICIYCRAVFVIRILHRMFMIASHGSRVGDQYTIIRLENHESHLHSRRSAPDLLSRFGHPGR